MSNIHACDGSATVDMNSLGSIFVGSTAPGLYPPIGKKYERFTFTPKSGKSGILVFKSSMCGDDIYHFYQFWWDGNKLVVGYQIKRAARTYSESEEMGFMVRYRDGWYVTKEPAVRDQNYKIVDLLEMLKYIEGSIDLAELDRNARSYERRIHYFRHIGEVEDELLSAIAKSAILDHYRSVAHPVIQGIHADANTGDAFGLKRKIINWLLPGRLEQLEQIIERR